MGANDSKMGLHFYNNEIDSISSTPRLSNWLNFMDKQIGYN